MLTKVIKRKGQITFGLATTITLISLVASAVSSIGVTQVSTQKEFGEDRQRIATIEEAIRTLKDDNKEIKKLQNDQIKETQELKILLQQLLRKY